MFIRINFIYLKKFSLRVMSLKVDHSFGWLFLFISNILLHLKSKQ